MGPKYRIIVVLVLCLTVGACGSTTPGPADPSAPSGTNELTATGDQPGSEGGDSTSPGLEGGNPGGPPGVPGGPITYDTSRAYIGGPKGYVKSGLEQQLREEAKCGPNLCGVKVVISGDEDCVEKITPSPVYPGGTITVFATMKCDTDDSTTEPTTTTSRKPITTTTTTE